MSHWHPDPPTTEECRFNAIKKWGERTTMAIMYPQMGGYSGCAVAVSDGNGCFDVYVWHDGEFPFAGDQTGNGDSGHRPPTELHHCDAEQFIRFGQQIKDWIGSR
jgi:hypothetical protein